MSIQYENGNHEYNKVSRYSVLRVILELPENQRYLETYNDVIIPESKDDTYHLVNKIEEGRLDIISNEYYGTPNYWWAIALANRYIDPFVINEGEMIRIPSLVTISNVDNEIINRRGGLTRATW